jgi:hypothetical protein
MASIQNVLLKDQKARNEFTLKPVVFNLKGETTELLPPGSGTIIITDEKSTIFGSLSKALKENNIEHINAIVSQNKKKVAALRKLTSQKALEMLLSAETYVNVNYESKTLAVNLFTLEGTDFTRVLFPFSGGSYESDKFRYTCFTKSDNQPAIKVMIVTHEPKLSTPETIAMRNITKEMSSMNFGPVGGETLCTPAALVASLTPGILVATVATALGRCHLIFRKLGEEAINPEITMSLKEIVALRQKALLSSRIV